MGLTIYQNGPCSPSVTAFGAAAIGGVSSSPLLTAMQPVATGFPYQNNSGAQGPGVTPNNGVGFSAGAPANAEVSLNLSGGAQIWLVAALLLMGAYIAFEK